jgi:hypothetical protein
MRPTRVRPTMRGLMFAVAVAALLMGAAVHVWRRREAFLREAGAHAREAGIDADIAWGFDRGEDDGFHEEAARYWRRYDHHQRLREKYERAAALPWVVVSHDPPAPE